MADSESAALPLGDTPINGSGRNIIEKRYGRKSNSHGANTPTFRYLEYYLQELNVHLQKHVPLHGKVLVSQELQAKLRQYPYILYGGEEIA